MSAQAYRDENGVPTIIAALNTNGSTVTRIKANPTTHGISINDNTTGSDHGPTNDLRDDNFVPCLMAVSNSDGFTPVVCYSDSSGNLLIDST